VGLAKTASKPSSSSAAATSTPKLPRRRCPGQLPPPEAAVASQRAMQAKKLTLLQTVAAAGVFSAVSCW